MTEHEPTLYDELGVAPGASPAALRAGYRNRARQLHPDVAGAPGTGDAMRRLNEAWAVLGDPERRRRYDDSIPSPPAPLSTAEAPTPQSDTAPPAAPRRRIAYLRPSALVLLILAVLFVVTAYAGSWPGNEGGAPQSTVSTTPGTAIRSTGQCLAIRAGPAAIVPCTAPNDGQILAEVTDASQCPTGTVGHPSPRRPTVLCTTSAMRPAP